MSKLIDLTHLFVNNMPAYPGDPCGKLYEVFSMEKGDICTLSNVECSMHVGTHIDAPLHMLKGGAFISDFELEKFTGRGVLVDVRNMEKIDVNSVKEIDLRKGDMVLFWTGWDKKFHTDAYYAGWPALTKEIAEFLVQKEVSMIGMDIPSPDPLNDTEFVVHKILLAKDILIMENMTKLDLLAGKKDFIVHAYPVKFKAEGAPVRAFAELAE